MLTTQSQPSRISLSATKEWQPEFNTGLIVRARCIITQPLPIKGLHLTATLTFVAVPEDCKQLKICRNKS